MNQLLTRVTRSFDAFKIQVRYKNPDHHWSVIKKKKTAKDKALHHFDDFYKSVYGKSWCNIRSALLSKNHKYMAVVNNFSNADKICTMLQNIGAVNIKDVYDVRMLKVTEKHEKRKEYDKCIKENISTESRMSEILAEKQLEEVKSVYPVGCDISITNLKQNVPKCQQKKENYDEDDLLDPFVKENQMKPVELKSIELNTETKIEQERIIEASVGLSASTLFEYMPPTKIKGYEDWILESDHYNYFRQGADFSIEVIDEKIIQFPKYLSLYSFEESSNCKFPNPRKGNTGVSDYYLLDGGSILPVLALDLQPGDNVLDMCAAPGGKTLTMIQTLMPRVLVANDSKLSRINRLNDVLEEYVSNIGLWTGRLFVTQQDARMIIDQDIFNKILVDVPCTTDRHVLHEDDNNIFRSDRIKERLLLPELQAAILTNALKIIAPGGTVVYSTCSLSPVQNEGVVKMAMKTVWEETTSQMAVVNMSEALEPLKCLFKFDSLDSKYGHTVIPTLQNNWGPMYFCKIKRLR